MDAGKFSPSKPWRCVRPEEPLMAPVSSDEGSGLAAGQGMCCVAEVMVEGRRAISGSRSTENKHLRYTWSVVARRQILSFLLLGGDKTHFSSPQGT